VPGGAFSSRLFSNFNFEHFDRQNMDSARRSIVKALSWRAWATTETMVISYLVTGSLKFAAGIGALDACFKIGTYFVHERIWNKIQYGRPEPTVNQYEI
jgi:uncharacterized membrane protein